MLKYWSIWNTIAPDVALFLVRNSCIFDFLESITFHHIHFQFPLFLLQTFFFMLLWTFLCLQFYLGGILFEEQKIYIDINGHVSTFRICQNLCFKTFPFAYLKDRLTSLSKLLFWYPLIIRSFLRTCHRTFM